MKPLEVAAYAGQVRWFTPEEEALGGAMDQTESCSMSVAVPQRSHRLCFKEGHRAGNRHISRHAAGGSPTGR